MIAPGKTRLLLIIAVGCLAVLAVVIMTRARSPRPAYSITAIAPKSPSFFHAMLFHHTSVYFEFKDGALRSAMTPEELVSAVAISATPQSDKSDPNVVRFPEATLPIPANQLPEGITAVRANFELHALAGQPYGAGATFLNGQIGFCRIGDQNSEWEYLTGVAMQAGDSLNKAPVIEWPSMGKTITLDVIGKPDSGALGVGISVEAGRMRLTDIRRSGKSVNAMVKVLDSSGKEVASKSGPMADFGFS